MYMYIYIYTHHMYNWNRTRSACLREVWWTPRTPALRHLATWATWVVIFQGDSTSDLGVSKTGGSVKWMVKGESHGKPDQN